MIVRDIEVDPISTVFNDDQCVSIVVKTENWVKDFKPIRL
jgi:hypothetical protein